MRKSRFPPSSSYQASSGCAPWFDKMFGLDLKTDLKKDLKTYLKTGLKKDLKKDLNKDLKRYSKSDLIEMDLKKTIHF